MKAFSKILIIFAILFASVSLQAQNIRDAELSKLVSAVKLLRTGTQENYEKATQILTDDTKWTAMSETGAVRNEECSIKDKVSRFKLNRILSKAESGRKYVSTHGDMINGEDARFDYSLYERSLKAGKSASYTLKGRSGEQTFVIVPYSTKADIDVSLKMGNSPIKFTKEKQADGTVIVRWTEKTPGGKTPITISLTNKGSEPQAFVIINHNTRK